MPSNNLASEFGQSRIKCFPPLDIEVQRSLSVQYKRKGFSVHAKLQQDLLVDIFCLRAAQSLRACWLPFLAYEAVAVLVRKSG